MGKQLFINNVKITSVNNLALPSKEFSKGFNIVCGSNEAGKSSMMLFLKNCFHEPIGLVGDIELTMDDTKYQIKIEGNQRPVNKRLKLLAPIDKTLDDILPLIDRNFYQKAFTINLDDIKTIDNELFDIIQDHNALSLKACKNRLDTEVRTYLTDGGKATKEITKILNEIKKLDKSINELTLKEKEYSEILNSIQSTETNLATLSKKIENKKLFNSEIVLKNEIETISEKINIQKANFNEQLAENKQIFFDINNKTALTIKNIEELNELTDSKLKDKIDELISYIDRNYNLKLNLQEIEQIDISREFESKLRTLQTEIDKQVFQINEYNNKKTSLEKEFLQLQEDLSSINKEIQNLNITNPQSFIEGISELRDAISSLAEATDNMPERSLNITNAIYILTSLTLIGLGIYYHNIRGLIVGIAGLLILGLSVKDLLKPQKSNDTSSIYNYISEEIFPKLNRRGEFLRTITGLNSIANTEEAKLKDFERYQKELEKKETDLKAIHINKEDVEQALILANETLNTLQANTNTLTTISNKTYSINVIYELLNDIRELRELLAKLEQEKSRKEKLEQDIESYIREYSEFLNKNNLDSGINKASLGEHTQRTLEIIEVNEKSKHELEALSKQLIELQAKLSQTPTEDLSPEQDLQELEAEFNNLNIDFGTLKGKKKNLEDFEGLIALQNEKNVLKQQLKDIVTETLKKKLTLNLIKQAEKQIRETEPNLINAENLLKVITNSKYTGADYSSRMIISSNGEFKGENELSRGTREQLYLAFRLGYAQNYGANGTGCRLPLIIDDAFVNFDKERLTNVLNALKEFAKTNQVLFFTCHKDYITSLIDTNNVNIIDLD